MKNLNEFYEAMRHLSRNESQIQEAWEEWNKVKWETAFDYDELKEGDCVIFPDFTISFVENGQGKTFVNQNGGWILYENQAHGLTEVQEIIEELNF
jgi:hypothetical protein